MPEFRLTKSARRYQERLGLRVTRRRPNPRRALDRMIGHSVPLSFPLPLPSLHYADNGFPSPDRGATQVWPNGTLAEHG
jgi:hypothetical protein